MTTAAISQLKARLSEYLQRVKSGEEIMITDRGTPVARLLPVSRAGAAMECLAGLERRGLVKRGSGRLPRRFWKMPKPSDASGSVLQALLEEREGGR